MKRSEITTNQQEEGVKMIKDEEILKLIRQLRTNIKACNEKIDRIKEDIRDGLIDKELGDKKIEFYSGKGEAYHNVIKYLVDMLQPQNYDEYNALWKGTRTRQRTVR